MNLETLKTAIRGCKLEAKAKALLFERAEKAESEEERDKVYADLLNLSGGAVKAYSTKVPQNFHTK